jgi:exodeoxyribonuclease VII large subunit
VVSGVGHEVDFTIADYVADYRAPTPSAAAEVVVQERVALLRQTRQHWQRLGRAMVQQLAAAQRRIDDASPQRLLGRLRDRVDQSSQYVDERRRDLAAAFDWFARDRQQALARLAAQIEALSPLAHLARGYAVCQRRADAAVVRDARQLRPGEMVDLRFLRGQAAARIEELPDG